MKYILKVTAFMILNVSELSVIVLSLMIYTSPFQIFPWYEPDTLEFVGIFLLSPIYIIIGVILNGLCKVLPISKINRLLPFLTFGGFVGLTLLIDNFYWLVVSGGILFGSIMFLVVLVTAIRDFVTIKKIN